MVTAALPVSGSRVLERCPADANQELPMVDLRDRSITKPTRLVVVPRSRIDVEPDDDYLVATTDLERSCTGST